MATTVADVGERASRRAGILDGPAAVGHYLPEIYSN
jgi:hypothetical protein